MVDTARHFLPVGHVYRTLDGMAAMKLNVFHWHFSDAQAFSYKSDVFPRLSEYGAYTPAAAYSRDQVCVCMCMCVCLCACTTMAGPALVVVVGGAVAPVLTFLLCVCTTNAVCSLAGEASHRVCVRSGHPRCPRV